MESSGSHTVSAPRDAAPLEGKITFSSAWKENRNRRSAVSHTGKSLTTDSDISHVSRVAPVTSPISALQRVNLPGVMDAEGRVDESRLRIHIFKNGNITPGMMCPTSEFTLLGTPSM